MQLVSNKPQPALDVPDQASAWIAKLSSDCVDESDMQGFALWLARSDHHKAVFDETLELWEDLGCVKYMPFDIPVTNSDNQPTGNLTAPEPKKSLHWKAPLAMAASLLLAIVLSPIWLDHEKPSYYSTTVGQQQSVQLDDGSTITLNTNTRLEVRLSDARREVYLHSGEAFFEVAKDPQRPFVVQSCSSKVQAVGTAFNVHCYAEKGGVMVTEGLVQVAAQTNKIASGILVEPGQSVDIAPSSGVSNLQQTDGQRALSWRKGQLVFEDTPLAEVIKQANRYSLTPIYLGSPQLAKLRVSGRFESTDTQTLLAALKVSLLLDSFVQDDKSIILNKAIQ